MLICFFVFRENSFASATVEIHPEQEVISTGLYGIVRHPMYMGALLFVVGLPLALGSWWGLLFVPAIAGLLAWRLVDEERLLVKSLAGYSAYRSRVRRQDEWFTYRGLETGCFVRPRSRNNRFAIASR